MAHLRGVTIELNQVIETGKDPFGSPIYSDNFVSVKNVLIMPTSSVDIVNQMTLTGKKSVYTLAIPKGDTHDWLDKEVIFFGKKWKTFGEPLEGIEELLPLDWNRKVTVEHYG